MTVKTLSAPTIASALAEARRLYGDDVVLLESHPPAGGQAARITVVAEETSELSADARSVSRVIQRVKTESASAVGSSGPGSAFDVLVEDDAAETDVFSLASQPRRTRARGRLFPADGQPLRSTEPVGPREMTRNLEELLENKLGTLQQRLEGIEQRFEGHPASAGKWLRHPLFNRLLDRGVPAKLVTRLFARATGGDEITDEDALYWSLARSIRDDLRDCASVQPSGVQLFVGPGGCGKTSLILRLATQRTFFGRRRCGVIVIAPQTSDQRFFVDPTDLYRRAGLPVQSVRAPEEVSAAIDRLHGFDHIFVDTPSLPIQPRSMRDVLAAFQPYIEQLLPLQVHFVLDATRSVNELDFDLMRRMPVVPDVIDITRMDETARPGRLYEWLAHAGRPVNFVTSSPRVNDGLSAFSAAAFAEELLSA